MNKQSSSKETQDIENYDQLRSDYLAISKEMPASDIDKQIIAAAHRELANPNAKKMPKNGWFRRLALPIYAAATFTFTALATHWFWPTEPAKTLPGTAPTTVTFEVMEPQLKVETPQKRTPRELPEPPVILQQPKADTMGEQRQQPVNILVEEQLVSPRDNPQITVAKPDNERRVKNVAKVTYPDKEKWARDIIQLFKKGEHETGRKELIRFKKAYPNYPIDGQLEVFLQ